MMNCSIYYHLIFQNQYLMKILSINSFYLIFAFILISVSLQSMGQRLVIIAKFCDCLQPYEAWTEDQMQYGKKNIKPSSPEHKGKDSAKIHNQQQYQSKNNGKHSETKTQNSLQTLFLNQGHQSKVKQFDLLDDKQLQMHDYNQTQQNIFNPYSMNKIQPLKLGDIQVDDISSQKSKESQNYSIIQLDKLPQLVELSEQNNPKKKNQENEQKHILEIRQFIDNDKQQYFLDENEQNQYCQQINNETQSEVIY